MGRLKIHEAEAIRDEEAAWVCESCSLMIEDDSLDLRHCRTCSAYWADASAGVFDDWFEPAMKEPTDG